jgi:hypothetical protein
MKAKVMTAKMSEAKVMKGKVMKARMFKSNVMKAKVMKATISEAKVMKSRTSDLYTTICSSPVGALQLVASDEGLVAVIWPNELEKKPLRSQFSGSDLISSDQHPVLVAARQQLQEYFDGSRQSFDVRLDLRGTAFQVRASVSCELNVCEEI